MKLLFALSLAGVPMPVLAQAMDRSMHHPGASSEAPPAPMPQQTDQHAGHAMPGMEVPSQADSVGTGDAPSGDQRGTDQAPGSAEPPPVVNDSPAARYWDAAAMAAAARAEMHPSAPAYAKFTLDLAEYQFRKGRDGYRWEGEFWTGDLNRFVIKSKGEGTAEEGLDEAEVHAVYAMALDPWWNLQVGLRQDIRPHPARTWATLGIEGRAPYQFEVQAAAFLSHKGEVTGRIEGAYDQRITQRLILQSRAELDFSMQDMADQRIGAGLATAEFGLRLRYELRRAFAPYVGINWTWDLGRTADYARADGNDTTERSVVAGIRLWF